jgi:hypothetical protein
MARQVNPIRSVQMVRHVRPADAFLRPHIRRPGLVYWYVCRTVQTEDSNI